MAFHDRIKEARLIKGYTQSALGDLIGVKKATISGYENGKSEPSMAIINLMMGILEIDANFLWQDEMKKPAADNGDRIDLDIKELNAILDRLSPDKRKEVLNFAKFQENTQNQ